MKMSSISIKMNLYGSIYTLRLCRMRQVYDRPATLVVSCKSKLQLAYDCCVGQKKLS